LAGAAIGELAPAGPGADGVAPVKIEASAGGVVIRLDRVSLGEAAERLSTASGIDIDVAPALRDVPITADVQAPTWGTALLDALAPYQTSVEWEDVEGGQPRRVWISATKTTRSAGPVMTPSSGDATEPAPGDDAPPPGGDPTIWSQEPPDDFVPPPLEGPVFTPAR
jgi:hypothetical protein